MKSIFQLQPKTFVARLNLLTLYLILTLCTLHTAYSQDGGRQGDSATGTGAFDWWNSCRVPWRLGTDILLHGDKPEVKALHDNGLRHLYNTLRATNSNFSGIRAVTFQGATISNGSGITFVSPAIVAAAAYGTAADMGAAWAYARGIDPMSSGRGYGAYINMLCMIVASGNWWKPEAL